LNARPDPGAALPEVERNKERRSMDEISAIINKYDKQFLSEGLGSLENANRFAPVFFSDVAEIYDCITRMRNVERNPTGFPLSDAPILGLLVRIWKLLKEIVKYYEANNAEIISILDRPLLEGSVVATFLMQNDEATVEDYRKCSYKDRLRILRMLKEGSPFFQTKPGLRLLRSINEKMEFEKFTEEDFAQQKTNRWRLQGKTFYDIFAEVHQADLYSATYGMMSESVHGSWNESMDFCLHRNEDGTFSSYPFYHEADIRFLAPTLRFCNLPFKLWIERIGIAESNLPRILAWVDNVNTRLFVVFDQNYDG
jgi:Family of unknown function (DUF5677)